MARRGGGAPPRLFGRDQAEREIAQVEKLGGRYLVLGQGLYPRLLAALDDAPPLLTAKGNLKLLDTPMVGMVGARNASAVACRFARALAHDLGQQGLTVVSGLARGIDSAAHDGALGTGTVGVVAGGLDVFYPPENEPRQRAMFEPAWCWPRCRPERSREHGTFPIVIGSFPGSAGGQWSWRRRRARDR